ncbi:MAG: GH32 C-terminal domain-containing protein [Ferruginibacter sp.]|nr:GH32 C-terminal domain-containing protein [Ferruginibacter sp.]
MIHQNLTCHKYFKTTLLILSCVLNGCFAVAQDTIAHWGFNEGAGGLTKENKSNTDFVIKSKWPVVEWVSGVAQKAMRTDGYSVWAEAALTTALPANNITITAWVAPEVYPVADAAVWCQYNNATGLGTWIGMDKFGRLKVEFSNGGPKQSFIADSSLLHYKWNYLVVNINTVSGTITGYINAVKVLDQSFAPGAFSWPTDKTTMIGKLPKNEVMGLYPINTMNALIDEVILLRSPLDQAAITQLYLLNKPAANPGIQTPNSRFANEFHRPLYHAIPASNWCNESHGLIYHNGKYHLFYQKNGNGSYLFQQNWGHLVSLDLVAWEEVQPALWPQPGWDNFGIWSGHAVIDQNNIPTIIYTGVNGIKAAIGLAKPATPDLLQWQKNPTVPVIQGAPATYPNKDFRDPYVFKEGATWYMIVGSGLQSPDVGTVFLYKSPDLNNWQFAGPMYSGNNQFQSGVFWEMPVFWKFGTRYMLLVNKVPVAGNPARAFYWVGNFANEIFTPSNAFAKNLELVNWLLSPSVNYDEGGRVTAIGIIPDLLPSSEQYKKGYANLFSLARVWDMQNDQLIQKPHPSLTKLRKDSVVYNNVNITTTGSGFLPLSQGFQMEIKASVNAANSQTAGLIIGKNPNGTEYTSIYYNYLYNEIVIDRQHHSLNPLTPGDIQYTSLVLDDPTAPINWHVFIDGSVIEVFVNDKYAFTSRYYPVSANSNTVDLFATGAAATANVTTWNLKSFSTLPVKWLSFTASPLNETVQLHWKVEAEVNNHHFEVERSTDGISFYSISLPIAGGNTGMSGNYYFRDDSPVAGKNYYRIKQVDIDGKSTYSAVLYMNLAQKNKASILQVMQNPAKDNVIIKFPAALKNTEISLWDVSGKRIYHNRLRNVLQNQQITIPVHGYAKGIYLLKAGNGFATETNKICIN